MTLISGLGVAGAQTDESHSLSILIGCLNFVSTSNSNYLEYISCKPSR